MVLVRSRPRAFPLPLSTWCLSGMYKCMMRMKVNVLFLAGDCRCAVIFDNGPGKRAIEAVSGVQRRKTTGYSKGAHLIQSVLFWYASLCVPHRCLCAITWVSLLCPPLAVWFGCIPICARFRPLSRFFQQTYPRMLKQSLIDRFPQV